MKKISLSQITFRKARITDLPEIVNIYNQAVKSGISTAELHKQNSRSKKLWFESHQNSRRPLLVFVCGNKVAAWLSFSDFYGRPAYRHTAEISIYVDKKFRNMGLGRYILKKAVSLSPSLQINVLLGFIFAANKPSIRLFEGMGFALCGRLEKVADMNGSLLDLLIFKLDLNNRHD